MRRIQESVMTMDAEQLKPCPFCGGSNLHTTIHRVYCYEKNCGAQSPYKSTTSDSIAAWNTRPAEAALIAEVERLTAALRDIDAQDLWTLPESGCYDFHMGDLKPETRALILGLRKE